MIFVYIITLISLTIFSFGFVDANFPTKLLPAVFNLIHNNRPLATSMYIALMTFLFIFYLWILRQIERKTLNARTVWKLIFLTAGILLFSFPAFSYDIFNYIATAKVAYLYKENPYLVMPIEIPNEPLLSFLHASNKVALYGPTWIALTFVPHVIGRDNLLLTIYAFKAIVLAFYVGLCWLIWYLSKKNLRTLTFFALNPIVITESLVSAHNDVVMMFFAFHAFFQAKKKRFWLGLLFLTLSVFVKGATVVLVPLYFLLWIYSVKDLEIEWKRIWMWGAILLLTVFFLAPVREELYPWYFIWPLTFVSLLPSDHFLQSLSYGFSYGLPFRFAPFIYYGDWGGAVPCIKKVVSSIPAAVSSITYVAKKTR